MRYIRASNCSRMIVHVLVTLALFHVLLTSPQSNDFPPTYGPSIPVDNTSVLVRIFKSEPPNTRLPSLMMSATKHDGTRNITIPLLSQPWSSQRSTTRSSIVYLLASSLFLPFLPHSHLKLIGIIGQPYKKDSLVFESLFYPDRDATTIIKVRRLLLL